MTALQETFKAIATAHADYAKSSFEQATAHVHNLTSSKTFEEAIGLQTTYAKAAFSSFSAEARKIGELYKSFAKETFDQFAAFPKAAS